jgi:hypothetical protein
METIAALVGFAAIALIAGIMFHAAGRIPLDEPRKTDESGTDPK